MANSYTTERLSRFPGRLAIVGAGGLGKEVLCSLGESMGWDFVRERVVFAVEPAYSSGHQVCGIDVVPLDVSRPGFDAAILAIGDLQSRIRLVGQLEGRVEFLTGIHPSAVLTPFTRIGEGSIVLANVHLSCDVVIGRHAIINPGTSFSHDGSAGDFFFAAPGVMISGHCHFGDRVFVGTGACFRNDLRVTSDVVIGAGAVVVNSIEESGTYLGVPARKA